VFFIETSRLVIRRFEVADGPAFAAYRSDPAVARYQSWQAPVPLEEAVATVSDFATGDPALAGWFQYAIALRADSEQLIGDIGVGLHGNLMQAEIGFTLDARYQGQGFATEAVRAMLRHLLLDKGLRRISAECDARNAASARLLQRLGFQREGLRRQHTWIKGEWTDDLLFGLLASEFRAWNPAGNRD
jgi:RimJ/RimL family protein N-acetyltransferase